jgi:hypothetical protein
MLNGETHLAHQKEEGICTLLGFDNHSSKQFPQLFPNNFNQISLLKKLPMASRISGTSTIRGVSEGQNSLNEFWG